MARYIRCIGRSAECHYCKRRLTRDSKTASHAYTRDHVNPVALGGGHTVACCLRCNQLKADMTFDRWQRVMQTYPEWWRRFSTHWELVYSLRIDGLAMRQPVQIIPHWPRYVTIPPFMGRGRYRAIMET